MFGKLTKSQFKSIKSLKQKKFRDENRAFIIEGKKMVDEALASSVIKMILVRTGTQLSISEQFDVYELSAKEMVTLSNMKTAPEIMAVCSYIPDRDLDFDRDILALDGVSDPGNMGTIIRICDWFGVEQIICHPGCVELYNPKVVQSTMGSLFRIKVLHRNIEDCIAQKPASTRVFAADMNGENVYQSNLAAPFFLIMGSESHGIRRELLDASDEILSIPRFGLAESLNVAVATSVLLSEFRRD